MFSIEFLSFIQLRQLQLAVMVFV